MSEERAVSAVPESGHVDWLVRRGDREFHAPDLATLNAWHAEGRLAGTDLVFHPTIGEWRTVAEVLTGPPHGGAARAPRSPSGRVVLFAAAGLLVVGGLTCFGALLTSARRVATGDGVESPTISEDREANERAFATRYGAALQAALANRGRDAANRGDVGEARAAMQLAARNHYNVGLEVAKDLSDGQLRRALRDHEVVQRWADGAVDEMLSGTN